MNCPVCGLPTVSDQKFCRSCGAGLQVITQPLPTEATIADPETTPAIIYKNERQRPDGLVLWGFIMMFIGAVIGVIGKKLLHEDIVTVVGILVSLAGMFLTAYPFLLPSPRKRYDSGPAPLKEVVNQPQQTKYLPQERNIEYVPSVTEKTTASLQHASVARPHPKEDGESEA